MRVIFFEHDIFGMERRLANHLVFFRKWLKFSLITILLSLIEAAARGVLCKIVFLGILQNSQENTFFTEHLWEHLFYSRDFIKTYYSVYDFQGKVWRGLELASLLKRRLQYSCFLVNFAKSCKNAIFRQQLRTTTSVSNNLEWVRYYCRASTSASYRDHCAKTLTIKFPKWFWKLLQCLDLENAVK